MRPWVIVIALLAIATPARADGLDASLDQALTTLDVGSLRGRAVLVGEVLPKLAWLSFHETHPALVRDALARAASHHGLHVVPGASVSDADQGPALLKAQSAIDGVVLFELASAWGSPRVKVWLYTRSGNAFMVDLSPPNDGLVSLAYVKIGLAAGALLAIVLGIRLLRGRRRRIAPIPTRPPPPLPSRTADKPAPRKHEDGIALSEGAVAMMREPVAPTPSASPAAHAATVLLAPATPDAESKISIPGLAADLAGLAGPPTRIRDRYRVIDELGRGAMGIVYRAHDDNLEREVAIKVLGEQMRAHPEALKLFAAEARTLAQLNHANIVSIYDQFSDRSEAVLVMELVEGPTLDRELARKSTYPWREALRIVDKVLAALAYAHGKNVIHRDIKPANIFITRDDVKLGDFGLARVMREAQIRSTEIRGTPLYMAPEQVIGKNIGHRADLYALGCTLFEMLASRPPFIEGEPLFAHVNTPPPQIAELVPDLPPAVAALVMQLLAKSADERPTSAAEVRERVTSLLTT